MGGWDSWPSAAAPGGAGGGPPRPPGGAPPAPPPPRRETFVGMEQLAFLCRARVDGREALYELKYTVSTHRWVLFRRIY